MQRHMSAVLAVLALVVSTAVSGWGAGLRVYHIDVEQGDATLLVSPGGHTMLVDSGKNGHGSRIKAVMERAGVSQIDVFVDTHYHEDHYGGIDDLVRDLGVPVLETYDRGDKSCLPSTKLDDPTHKDYLGSVGEDAIHLTRGKTIPFDAAIEVKCVSSGGVVDGEENPVTGVNENDMSISLLVTYGRFTYLLGGDIEKPTEAKIAARDLVNDVDAYHADHHGSDTSSLEEFMTDLRPTVIIISNGSNGKYKHPRQSVLDLYSTLPGPPAVFQTNKYLKGGAGGNVPDACIADPETNDEDGTILLRVESGADSMIVSYGAGVRHGYVLKRAEHGSVVIESLLPNPAGDDEQLEEVTIANRGAAAVALSGWTLRDRSNGVWSLAALGSIGPHESRTTVRNGQAMSLNNAGDKVSLLDAGSQVINSFEYSQSTEGVRITTGH